MKIIKTVIITVFVLAVYKSANAQEQPDTIKLQELNEVVVQAPKVIRKADMDVYHPSQSAVENSKNGMQLLTNLMIPTLTVNDILGTITTSGQSVQVRINGRIATIDQVKQLLPETIKRVEWIDNPGLRYNGAPAVLNFIVANPAVGGSLMVNAMPALNEAWGVYSGSLKLNNGHSQWGATLNYKNTNHVKARRDYYETFTRPSGESVTRIERPISGYVSDNFGGLQLDYSYIKPDTTTFWVAIHGFKQWPEATLYNSRMSLSNGSEDILLRDYSANEGFTPSFKAYFQQHFKHNQVVAIDFSGSFYDGNTIRSYFEKSPENMATITNVSTSIKDRNQAYGLTADYIKKWDNSRLTVGASYTANRNRSMYENLDNALFHQRRDQTYFYFEYFQRLNSFSITTGLGTQYTSFRFLETNQGNNSWNLRPQATVTYRHGNASSLDINFSSWQSAPSFAETNVVEQQIDAFQWQKGNPNLKTSSSYMLTFRYNYTSQKVSGQFGARAFTSPNAITPFYQWKGDKLFRSFENSDGLSNLSFWLAPEVEVIPGWFTIEGTLQYRVDRMKGSGYKLYNHNWSGDVTAMLTHWGFVLSVQYRKDQKKLWGESLTWGETLSFIQLQYNWRDWQFGAGMLCPFTKYDQGSKLLNRWNTNERHLRMPGLQPMTFLSISYNLQWGRQKRGINKLVNADSEVQQSSAAGR